jgi:hypothetical protein
VSSIYSSTAYSGLLSVRYMSDKPKSHANQGHADPDKGGRDQYKRHVDGDITIRGQIETHVPPDAANQHDTEREEDKAQAKKNYIVGMLTLIAVCVYAVITFWQGCLTRTAISDARENFAQDERARVGAVEYHLTFPVGQPSTIAIIVSNSGKTPAFNVHSEYGVEIVPQGQKPRFDYASPKLPGNVESFSTMQAGMVLTLRTHSMVPVTDAVIASLTEGRTVEYIYGDITYSDIFKHEHHAQFCAMVKLDLTHTADCKEHNESD